MTTSRRWASAAAAITLLGACGSEPATMDHEAVRRAVGIAVAARIGPSVRSTSCPDDIRKGEGRVTPCAVRLTGGLGTVRVRVRQVDDRGRLDVVLLDAVLDDAKVRRDLESRLATQFHRDFTADCGTGYRVVRPGGTFRCTASDLAGTRAVVVTVRDPAGTLAYDVSA